MKIQSAIIFAFYTYALTSLFLDAMLKLSKTTSPEKLFDYDSMTLYTFRRSTNDHDRSTTSNSLQNWIQGLYPQTQSRNEKG